MPRLTKEAVLGALATDLMIKAEKIRAQGDEQAAQALDRLAIQVVEKPDRQKPPTEPLPATPARSETLAPTPHITLARATPHSNL